MVIMFYEAFVWEENTSHVINHLTSRLCSLGIILKSLNVIAILEYIAPAIS